MIKDQVEYLPLRKNSDGFHKCHKDYDHSIQRLDLEGNVLGGAEAVFRVLACVLERAWRLWVYQNVPVFSWLRSGVIKPSLKTESFLKPSVREYVGRKRSPHLD